jgi:hypothetical protein
MEWAALIAWILTAGGGFILLSIWLARGGMRQTAGGSRIRPPLILSHFLLAAAGLVIWLIYVVTDSDALTWIAFVTLVVVAILGWTMFAIWYRQRQRGGAAPGQPAAPGASTPGTAGSAIAVAAEQHFPVAVVAIHGLLAVTTVVLVFLTAVGVGE